MKWSDQQLAIFKWFESGAGHLVVRARAGTGKTTTILEGLNHAPETDEALLCAFNKRIAQELAQRLGAPNAEALTLHSVGFKAVRMFWRTVSIERSNGARAFGLARAVCGDQTPDAVLTLVAKLHSRGREMAPLATSGGELEGIAWEHDCVPDPEWEDYGFDLPRVCALAFKAMEAAKQRTREIDFSDMLFLPIVNGWLRPRYDLVVVDEAQDMNAAQLLIAQRVARGRICVVGDDRQAIYKFRGADSGAIDRLKEALGAAELGLTVTYRCGKTIVREARSLVPDYEAHESNPDGVVDAVREDQILEHAKLRDVVLSRFNAPLIDLCLKALRQGVPARVEGRDVAAGLKKLVGDLAKGPARSSIPAFLKRLSAWEAKQIARVEASDVNGSADAKIAAVQDKAAALRALAEGASGIAELTARLDEVFAQIKSGAALVLSSVHKAKGLEWDRVFLLANTFTGKNREEANIEYVAITRAISRLTWAWSEATTEDDGKEVG